MKYLWDARYELADRDEIRALQMKRLRRVLLQANATNDFYRRRFRAAGVDVEKVATLKDFARLPTVQKADFVADQAEAPPHGKRHEHVQDLDTPLFVYTTSGTSGQGQEVHMQTSAELETSNRHVYPYAFRWAGLSEGNSLMLAMPITMLGGGRLEYHAALSYGLTVYPVGNYDADRKLDLLRRFQPNLLLGNSSYLGRLGSLLEPDERIASLRALISGGEASGLSWLLRLQEMWGVPVFDRYGCSQTGNDHMFSCDEGIGTAERPGMLHNVDPFMLVEVIDPESGRHVADGEAGELVLTSLYRLDSPLIRCRVADRAVYREPGYCRCGRPFMGVEVATVSRADDMRKIKGLNVWPQAVDEVIFAFPEVAEYQVDISTAPNGADMVVARAMLSSSADPEGADELRTRMLKLLHQRIGIHFEVEVVRDGEIEIDALKARRWTDTRAHVLSEGSAYGPAGDRGVEVTRLRQEAVMGHDDSTHSQHADLLDLVDQFVRKELAPRAPEIDASNEFPQDIYTSMGRLGLFGAWVPEEYGGLGKDLRLALAVQERLARASAACALMFANCGDGSAAIIHGGVEEVRQQYLPGIATGEIIPCFALTEPQAGSDAGGIRTRAVREGSKYRIRGEKIFCTNGSVGHLYVVYAVTDPSAGNKGITAFLVPRDAPGVAVVGDEELLGLRGSPTSSLVFDDVTIDEELRLGAEGEGFRLAMETLDDARLSAAAITVGIAKAAVRIATEYAAEREQFGQRILEFQGVQFLLANAVTQIAAGEALLQTATGLVLSAPSRRSSAFASMAKLFCTDMAMTATTDAVQVLGGYGLVRGFQVERMMRDAKAFQIFDGTNQIQKMIIGRYLLRSGFLLD